MRLVAIILGALLVDVAYRGTFQDSAVVNGKPNGDGKGLWPLLKKDFEAHDAQGNFIAWFTAILLIGALGYVEPLKSIANTMLALVIIVLLLSNGGFFAKFQQAVSPKVV